MNESPVILTIGGSTVTLHRDGRLTIEGTKKKEDLLGALAFLSRPSSGREWWPFFLVHHIQDFLGDTAASEAAKKLSKNTSRVANMQNRRFVEWILAEGLHRNASVEAVSASKSTIWDATAKPQTPKTDRDAQLAIQLLHEGKSWADIKAKLGK